VNPSPEAVEAAFKCANMECVDGCSAQNSLQVLAAEVRRLRTLLSSPSEGEVEEALGKWLRRWPHCSREGLCREKWEGPSFQDDCYSCEQRQILEREIAALRPEDSK
jgi:hypothetical protein